MRPPEDQTRLRHMLKYAIEASAMVHGRTREDLDKDRMLNLALVRLLEIVGEAAARVTEVTRNSNSEIQWTGITGLRNRLIHGYDAVDFDILWDIVQNDLPILIAQLQAVVADEEARPEN